ncbi:Photoreceptor outer segment membrane glycoprotein 2 [Amphibalanus amphitrite]|uniref:Photoreceptor outer segment membrane glycoprotein 2 n=1 Tax=Amphibalanus amphitrite TaxID=1232801 RepID=A0A6A4VWE9_AMPAM|nr:Photoreceptor outer segment membrane glycoprotein 2 [Amphibalanus amphitrite]
MALQVEQAPAMAGVPSITLSEGCRQLLLTLLLLLAALSINAGVVLVVIAALLRPRLDEHAPVLPKGALLRELHLLVGGGAASLATGCLSLIWATSARARGKSRRRAAQPLGWMCLLLQLGAAGLLLALALLVEVRLRAFQTVFHAGFSRTLWRYADTAALKGYVDRTQARYQCCGALGFSDWFVVDWYPVTLFVARYLEVVRQRQRFAKLGQRRGNPLRASFAMQQYGSEQHAQLVTAAIEEEMSSQQLQADLLAAKQLGFSEVPFSCCDPESPQWCRQMFVTESAPHYRPPANLTVFTAGCSDRVPALFGWYLWLAGRAALAVAALQLVMALVSRYWQTSASSALAAGRHLSPAPGWLIPTCSGLGI